MKAGQRAVDDTVAPQAGRETSAILFDRDGTLIVDVPFNVDPALVRLMPNARRAIARLRDAGLRFAVVTNQSGIGLGRLTRAHVDGIHRRMEDLLGSLGPAFVCEHAPNDGCACRKPAPGLIRSAARDLDVRLDACVVVGDIGADVEAATAAGARSILIPTVATRGEEIAAAPCVASDLDEAASLILTGRV
jgi:D-glycero-D-manno-heptose 1,7-bisphosphate phosphatase